MKKILLFLIGLFYGLQSFAQDPDLYQTWYLYHYLIDPSPRVYISEIDPPISPFLTIDASLDFSGQAACNTFTGNFVYDTGGNNLNIESIIKTNDNCGHPDHISFEADFFSERFFTLGNDLSTMINSGSGNEQFLKLFHILLSDLSFSNQVLSISDISENKFKTYPNPVLERLFIVSENTQIENIRIYSINGKQVLDDSNFDNSLDVSGLSEGVYFIEIQSSEGKSIQKFIKQ